MSPADDIEFLACPPGEPPARTLIEAMVAELKDLYGITEGRLGVPLDPAELGPPGGVYLVGWAGRETVGGGGLRTIGPALGEIKRMYVAPSWRGRGVARRLLGALEDAARSLGHERVRLDTGPLQPEARHLYQTAGYVSIPDYNDNHHAAFWGEKVL